MSSSPGAQAPMSVFIRSRTFISASRDFIGRGCKNPAPPCRRAKQRGCSDLLRRVKRQGSPAAGIPASPHGILLSYARVPLPVGARGGSTYSAAIRRVPHHSRGGWIERDAVCAVGRGYRGGRRCGVLGEPAARGELPAAHLARAAAAGPRGKPGHVRPPLPLAPWRSCGWRRPSSGPAFTWASGATTARCACGARRA